MKTIKYRAWDKRVEGWVPLVASGSFSHKRNVTVLKVYKDIVVMQFTGLKDKNGKECYESDIVRYKNLLGTENIDVITWEDRCFSMGGLWANDFEIIGNVHENPDLL